MESHPSTSVTRRKILVVGATGKQGRALIQALVNPNLGPSKVSFLDPVNGSNESDKETIVWDILALTRDALGSRSQSLLKLPPKSSAHTIKLVQGDLNIDTTILSIFARESSQEGLPLQGGGIWGVFVVLMYPGLGAQDSEVEIKQGKLLADLSHKFGVQAFVYSSSLPTGMDEGDDLDPSHLAKRTIEAYCQELGRRDNGSGGLRWIVVRPGFFMENFDGFLGSIAVAILSEGLTKDVAITLTASKDIGRVVAGVLKNHAAFIHRFLAITSGPVTMQEITSSYQRATGKPMAAIPAPLVRLLIKINTGCQRIIKETQRNSDARKNGEYYPEFEAELALAKSICHMQTYEEWKRTELELAAGGMTIDAGWNKVSIWKLITGRS